VAISITNFVHIINIKMFNILYFIIMANFNAIINFNCIKTYFIGLKPLMIIYFHLKSYQNFYQNLFQINLYFDLDFVKNFHNIVAN
jgi:hypothetical protein